MRIEAQGKYLQAILEKAQKSLSSEMCNNASLEATRAQLTDFNLALSGLMENMRDERKEQIIPRALMDGHDASHQLQPLQLYNRHGQEDVKLQAFNELHLFDLNLKGHGQFEFMGSQR